MAEIFVSYAREDADYARSLRDTLKGSGPDRTIWWDHEIQIGERWEPAIEAALAEARCVVVLWSQHSIGSEFVQREARTRFDDGIVVQVRLDEELPPSEFASEQAASVVGWDRSATAQTLQPVLEHVTTLLSIITVVPSGVVLVVGDPSRYPEMIPTINIDAILTNDSDRAIQLVDLALDVVRMPGRDEDGRRDVYGLTWHLWYEPDGLEHVLEERDDDDWTVRVSPHDRWAKGCQFKESRRRSSGLWRAGTYECLLRGWTDRSTQQEANMKTRFSFGVLPSHVREMRSWLDLPPEWWKQWSNRAKGMWVPYAV